MAVSLYVVMLRSVGADGGPDGWGWGNDLLPKTHDAMINI